MGVKDNFFKESTLIAKTTMDSLTPVYVGNLLNLSRTQLNARESLAYTLLKAALSPIKLQMLNLLCLLWSASQFCGLQLGKVL